jgi:hypothetical protein
MTPKGTTLPPEGQPGMAEMNDRHDALRCLVVGDFFHANGPNGASLTCLVTNVIDNSIFVRVIMSQIELIFDARSGAAARNGRSVICAIDSIAPLPDEIRSAILAIDEKFRTEKVREHLKLTDTEIKAVQFLKSHYLSNPLPL